MKKDSGIEEVFLLVLKDHTAGNHQKEDRKWTDLSVYEIRQRLKKKGFDVGKRLIKKILSILNDSYPELRFITIVCLNLSKKADL